MNGFGEEVFSCSGFAFQSGKPESWSGDFGLKKKAAQRGADADEVG